MIVVLRYAVPVFTSMKHDVENYSRNFVTDRQAAFKQFVQNTEKQHFFLKHNFSKIVDSSLRSHIINPVNAISHMKNVLNRTGSAMLLSNEVVSRGATVSSSVRGNLAPVEVIINGKNKDWLKDRWQAAKNMQGVPIPGEHWVQLDFRKTVKEINSIVLDWETAFANKYAIEVSDSEGGWSTLYSRGFTPKESPAPKYVGLVCGNARRDAATRKKHVVVTINCQRSGDKRSSISSFRVKMIPGTKWGVSLWEVDVLGKFL